MKIIDLLNTPLDKFPKKIKVENNSYTLYINEANQHYYQDDKCKYFLFSIKCFDDLNDEVEIIEEGKGIPKKVDFNISNFTYKEYELNIMRNNVTANTKAINQIIDYLKSKGDE